MTTIETPGGTQAPWHAGVALFDLADWAALEVKGPDAVRFLQGQTTADVQAIGVHSGAMGALLSPKGQVRFVVTLFCPAAQTYWLFCPEPQLEALNRHLEAMHFSEDLTIAPMAPWPRCVVMVGPYAPYLASTHASEDVVFYPFSWPAAEGVAQFCVIPHESWSHFEAHWHSETVDGVTVAWPTEEAWGRWTLEAGIPQWPQDIPEATLLSETPLEPWTVSLTKGCYVGQEVVTKIRTQGRPPRSMVGLKVQGSPQLGSASVKVFRGGLEAGTLGRGVFQPDLDETWFFLSLKRGEAYSVDWEPLTLGTTEVKAQIVPLPFVDVVSPQALAQQHYEQAIHCVTAHQTEAAMRLLKQVLALNPTHADALEVLGVLHSQQGQVHQAIELMNRLRSVDPQSVMAHTNLSRFYLMLGDKDRAETEKARATVLQFQQAMGPSGQPTGPSEEEIRKIAMFQEVLSLDPEDPLANFSLGHYYLEKQQPQQALSYLQTAVAADPRYSVAYLDLAKALKALNRPTEAREVLEKGIGVAQKQGDWMPLKSMEALLSKL